MSLSGFDLLQTLQHVRIHILAVNGQFNGTTCCSDAPVYSGHAWASQKDGSVGVVGNIFFSSHTFSLLLFQKVVFFRKLSISPCGASGAGSNPDILGH